MSISTAVALPSKHFNISGGMLSGPSALLFFISFSASDISSVIKSGTWSSTVLHSSPMSTLPRFSSLMYNSFAYSFYLFRTAFGSVSSVPVLSWMAVVFLPFFLVLSCFIFW